MTLADQGKRLEAVAGLGDDLDVRLRVEQGTHALTLDGVIVHEQDADLGGDPVHSAYTPFHPTAGAGSTPPSVRCFIRLDSRVCTGWRQWTLALRDGRQERKRRT